MPDPPTREMNGGNYLVCADCLIENFGHDSDDPHLLHSKALCGVENRPAYTIIGGRAVCDDHVIRDYRGDNDE